ncbi:MAG: 1-(5-phosphoribosyl)-5-[(5-phosphoribosylamino)methylideneamino]imidazole-4-carboxamide isomerase [Bacteroidetes bacterium]|nr:1-(5-phosphoribosyl)-5-[(5-phosphoribosylamino)methylideneamino]imidazole-4-carboxamide isomerase [Bacteroidota bacterium]
MNIIPAIDIIDGKCVRLQQGNYDKVTIYNVNPIDIALQYQDIGIRHLHLVDLDGAKKGKVTNLQILEKIANATNLYIDFGGGIRTDEDIQLAFDSGAGKVTLGSIAIKDKAKVLAWQSIYGGDRIILGADCQNGMIAVNGWTNNTSVDVVSFIREYRQQGLEQIMCTDISCDGMLAGPAIPLYKGILSAVNNIQLIASGGIRSIEDLKTLKQIGCAGAIIGKAFYEGYIQLNELRNYAEETNNSVS